MKKQEKIEKTISILKKNYGNTLLASLSNLDAWKILIATILSARSKDEQTEPIAKSLFERYKNAKQLAKAKKKDVEKIIKKIGFYHQKAKYIIETSKLIVDEFNNKVPQNYESLMKCPGVGRKVAGCVLVYAFGVPAIPVDTHIHRISNRLGLVKTSSPEKTELELLKIVPKKHWFLVNDVLVNHGKTICSHISPWCSKCSIEKLCYKVGVEKRK
ncbi:MAG: endonuclease III [Nanoarchaeota archaeon]|nr:endonuclease III [Nanoarchaeota archaeon]MBU1946121.1 endonuclease III [Nanoarchaeota archaeon]